MPSTRGSPARCAPATRECTTGGGSSRRRWASCIGVGLLVAGVATKDPWIGVAGFVVMLACSMWALTSYRHMAGITHRARAGPGTAGPASAGGRRPGRAAKAGPASGMMERLEERWRRRQERGDR